MLISSVERGGVRVCYWREVVCGSRACFYALESKSISQITCLVL